MGEGVGSLARHLLRPLGILAVIVTVLLLVSPFTSATSSTRNRPPYTSATTFATNVTVLVQNPIHPTCANASLSIPPTGHISNGSEFVASESTAHTWHNCLASVTTRAGFFGPSFNSTASRKFTITYAWQVPWIIKGRDPAENRINVSVFGNLFDNTTGRWALGGNASQSDVVVILDRSVGGLTAISGSTRANVSFAVTLVSGHQYLFYTGLYTQTSVFTKASGYVLTTIAKLIVGNGRSGARLLSITAT
jgi:hypothetical protein